MRVYFIYFTVLLFPNLPAVNSKPYFTEERGKMLQKLIQSEGHSLLWFSLVGFHGFG